VVGNYRRAEKYATITISVLVSKQFGTNLTQKKKLATEWIGHSLISALNVGGDILGNL